MMNFKAIISDLKCVFIILNICGLWCGLNAQKYNGHKLLRVYANSRDDVDALHRTNLHLIKRGYLNHDDISDIDAGESPSSGADIVTSEEAFPHFSRALNELGLPYDVISDDVQRDIDDHLENNDVARLYDEDYHKSFHPIEEIHAFMDILADQCDGRCQVLSIGSSHQDRPLKVMKISGEPSEGKQKIWIDAGIHAREWISHATAQYIMNRLIADYEEDPLVKQMVDKYDWYILPSVNPDGYVHSWRTDRLWRKTRRPNPGSSCVGTDANRNFDFKWGEVGVSTDPCANNFQGPRPYSEVEAKSVADFIMKDKASWLMYLSLHSKGQLIMAPWGYTTDKPQDYQDLENVGLTMKEAIRQTHGKDYTFGSASEILYKSSGTSRDWACGVPGIKYVYTIELRDRGQYGWLLPPNQIVPTGQEIWEALKVAINTILTEQQ